MFSCTACRLTFLFHVKLSECFLSIFCCRLQFAVFMWILTYVGALFNGLTLVILGEQRENKAL